MFVLCHLGNLVLAWKLGCRRDSPQWDSLRWDRNVHPAVQAE